MRSTLALVGLLFGLSSCNNISLFSSKTKSEYRRVNTLPNYYQITYRSLDRLPDFGHTLNIKPENFVLTYDAVATIKPLVGEGEASWYGDRFHGQLTASGEPYNMNDLTAAHPSLPLGTKVWVENEENGRMVRVRINDRGPYWGKRILDLSKAAAKELGMVKHGGANVKIYPVFTKGNSSNEQQLKEGYTIRLASFRDGKEAFEFSQKLENTRVEVFKKGDYFSYGVFYGLYQNEKQAFGQLSELKEKDYSGLVMLRERSLL